MTNRRLFMIGAAAAIATPAIVRASSLMRVVAPRLIMPPVILIPSDLNMDGIYNFDEYVSWYRLDPKITPEDWRYVTRIAAP